EPAILDADFERRLLASWSGTDPATPATAFAVRERIERYATRTPRERAAVVCTAALRPLLADFLLRCGIRVGVFAYAELPSELRLVPAEIISEPALVVS
ncbi:MAG: hypothetical protein JOZ01_08175, partial [Candidatus Eremiobacteraeota bacterium]|nr:hypothetical protein [Candidatus Eremiobacteraeota bacterium]